MTTFGWDASHYDGELTETRIQRAMAEGIEFATHKLGEGGTYTDPLAKTNLNAMHDAGLRVIGAYYVPRTPGKSVAYQVDHCIDLADGLVPWWRDFHGWCWQDDLELWDNDRVSARTGIEFGQLLRAKSGRRCLLYASKGMYGDQLGAWAPEPLWNANYGSNPAVPFRDAYPGDRSTRWAAYSGQVPAVLQYGSRTTIAGLATCDADAYRGTIDELLALIGGDTTMPLEPSDISAIWGYKVPNMADRAAKDVSAATAVAQAWGEALDAGKTAADVEAAVAVLTAKVNSLAVGGVDMAALRALIREELDATRLSGS